MMYIKEMTDEGNVMFATLFVYLSEDLDEGLSMENFSSQCHFTTPPPTATNAK